MKIILLVLFSIIIAIGQLLFKKTSQHLSGDFNLQMLVDLLTNLWFITAVFFYGAATLLWVYILKDTPLSFAYPFVALGFIIIPVASWFIWNEPISFQYAVGTALILSGIFIIVKSSDI